MNIGLACEFLFTEFTIGNLVISLMVFFHKMVWRVGFEPTCSCVQGKRGRPLLNPQINFTLLCDISQVKNGLGGGNRTHDLLRPRQAS